MTYEGTNDVIRKLSESSRCFTEHLARAAQLQRYKK